MDSNHLRFANSLSNLRFCSRVSGGARSLSVAPSNVGSSRRNGRSVNLPPVDTGRRRKEQMRRSSAVDLLQLANDCAKKKSSVNLGSSTSTEDFHKSVASAPEMCRKQTMATRRKRQITNDAKVKHPSVKVKLSSGDFAKSWPLHPHGGAVDRLPVIVASDERNVNPRRSQISGDLSRFNKSTNFRMNRAQEPPKEQILLEASNEVVIETLSKLKLTQASSGDYPSRKPSSSSSDLTTVTTDSVQCHHDNEPEVDSDQEEVDRKCITWLEGVARERIRNPEKLFLPHLLMS